VIRRPGRWISAESGASGSGFIGIAHQTSGQIRFTAAYGARERRWIVAVVNSYGRPRGE
jgi:hypothetical protein